MPKKSAKPTFGDRVKSARLDLTVARKGYVSPETLGEELGVSGQSVRNWESGINEPNLDTIKKLAKALGRSAGFLAFGEEDNTTLRTAIESNGTTQVVGKPGDGGRESKRA